METLDREGVARRMLSWSNGRCWCSLQSTDCRSIALRKNETQGDDGLAKSASVSLGRSAGVRTVPEHRVSECRKAAKLKVQARHVLRQAHTGLSYSRQRVN